ncbi:MAG: alpha/beta fold hydrolase [Myxococcota bacterium]
MDTRTHTVDNGHGWTLELRQTARFDRLDVSRPPVVILPGYGMNDFIFRYHPTGRSMVGDLACDGLEVWTVNFRGQGKSYAHAADASPMSLAGMALEDLPAAFDAIRQRTETRQAAPSGPGQLDVIGCSLGCAVGYGYLAHHPMQHPIRTMVAMAGPLRWSGVHPALRLLSQAPGLVGAIPFAFTRALAGNVLPLARRVPGLLRPYLTARRVDLRAAHALIQTVEDPSRHINRELAVWVRDRDLHLGGLNVFDALSEVQVPILCIYGNADGIVPPETARSIADAAGRVTLLAVGGPDHPYAHADLFISDGVHHAVFQPIRTWLGSAHRQPEQRVRQV